MSKRQAKQRRGGGGRANSITSRVLRSTGSNIMATDKGQLSQRPSAVLTPMNSTNRGPQFAVVDFKLIEDPEAIDWIQQVRDICDLPGAVSLGTEDRMREPVRLAPFLWLGDAGCAKNVEELKRKNIGGIVNIAGVDFQQQQYPASWDYLQVDIMSEFECAWDKQTTLSGDRLEKIFLFMHRCIDSGRSVFVHCMTGRNRSVAVCTAFLMLWFSWSLPKALSHVLSKRPGSLDNVALQEELVALARVNNLLVMDAAVSSKLEEAEGPAAHVWSIASGGTPKNSPAIRDRAKIVEAMLSLCDGQVDGSDLDGDLASLEDAKNGAIGWDRFKHWFIVGTARAG